MARPGEVGESWCTQRKHAEVILFPHLLVSQSGINRKKCQFMIIHALAVQASAAVLLTQHHPAHSVVHACQQAHNRPTRCQRPVAETLNKSASKIVQLTSNGVPGASYSSCGDNNQPLKQRVLILNHPRPNRHIHTVRTKRQLQLQRQGHQLHSHT